MYTVYYSVIHLIIVALKHTRYTRFTHVDGKMIKPKKTICACGGPNVRCIVSDC